MLGVAVARDVVESHVALGRPREEAEFVAQPDAAPGGDLRRDGQVVVGCQVEVVRRSDAQTRARVDRHGGEQKAALPGVVERKHHHRHAQQGVVAHLEAGVLAIAPGPFEVEVQLPGLQPPGLVVGFAAGKAAVEELHELAALEVDAVGLAPHTHRGEVVGGRLEAALAAVELQLQARTGHPGAGLFDGHIPHGIDPLQVAPVLDAPGRQRGADLA